jgi:hypothetical protein
VRVRNSTPGKERYYAIVAQDSDIEIEGVTSGTLHFRYNDGIPASPQRNSAPVAPMIRNTFRPPQIQVQHSLPQGGGSCTNDGTTGALEDLLEASTPTITQTNEIKKVLETPAVESRHVDPNSSPARLVQSSPTAAIQTTKTGLMIGGAASGTQGTDNLSVTDSEGEETSPHFAPTVAMEVDAEADSITATPGNEIPGRDRAVLIGTGNTAFTTPSEEPELEDFTLGSNTPPPNPIESPIIEGRSPKVIVGDVEGMDINEAEQADLNNLPDSLPDVFKYVQDKKLKTPIRMYGKKKGLTEKKTVEETPAALQGGGITGPDTATTAKGRGRKRKVDEGTTTTASSKKRKAKEITPVEEEETASEEEPEPPTVAKRGRRGKEAIARDDTESHSTAPEESLIIVKEQARIPTRKSTATPAKSRAAKGKKQQKAPTPEPKPAKKDDSQFDTQYTFTSTEFTTPAKTPRSRSKPKNTPSTTATTASRKPSSRTSTTPTPAPRTTDHYDGPAPRVAFTNSTLSTSKPLLRFLRSNHAKLIDSPSDPACNFLILGAGPLKRTPKLILAVARGLYIVTESWLRDSAAVGYWLDPDAYLPSDPEREEEWGVTLSGAVGRYREQKGQCTVFEGKTVYITASLLGQLKEMKSEEGLVEMLKIAGVEGVVKRAPRGSEEESSIVLGKEEGEKEAVVLEKAGWKLWNMAVVGLSILRGKLEGAEEWRVKPDGEKVVEKKGGKRKSGRSSA